MRSRHQEYCFSRFYLIHVCMYIAGLVVLPCCSTRSSALRGIHCTFAIFDTPITEWTTYLLAFEYGVHRSSPGCPPQLQQSYRLLLSALCPFIQPDTFAYRKCRVKNRLPYDIWDTLTEEFVMSRIGEKTQWKHRFESMI